MKKKARPLIVSLADAKAPTTKKKTTKKKPTRATGPALPALAGADQDDHRELQPRLDYVRAIQQQYAATIIAAGVFGSNPAWDGVLSALANANAVTSSRALVGLFDRLEKAAEGSTRLAVRWLPTDPAHETTAAEDVLTEHEIAWGEAGFLLGLAVGIQLGPHALDGVAK